MTEFYTEFDELQEALKKVRIDEDVAPVRYGMLVAEGQETYSKMQKLLQCNEMESAHAFVYNLDPENLEDDEIEKINKLYDLGVKKGYIDNSFEEEFDKEENPDAFVPAEEPAPVAKPQDCCKKTPCACWTVLYSATKNGETKCGECYSNAMNVGAAKADCLAKLARFGYENVSILAMEAGDPDCCCKDVEECDVEENDMLRDRAHNGHVSVNEEDEKDVEEDDILDKTPHNGKAQHNGHFLDEDDEDDVKECDGKEIEEDDDELTEEDLDDMVKEASGNPYAAGMKVVTGGKATAPAKAKKIKEDDEEGGEDSASDDEGGDDSASDDSAADEGSDDSGSDDSGSDDSASDDSSDDEGGDDAEGSDDSDSDDEGGDDAEGSDEEADDSEGDDEGGDDDSEGSDEGSDDDSDEGDKEEGDEEEEELDDEKKAELKGEYKQVFKDTMLKCKFTDKCFNDLTIEQKVTFFETLKEKWTKAEPNKFLSPKEEEQLNSVVVTE